MLVPLFPRRLSSRGASRHGAQVGEGVRLSEVQALVVKLWDEAETHLREGRLNEALTSFEQARAAAARLPHGCAPAARPPHAPRRNLRARHAAPLPPQVLNLNRRFAGGGVHGLMALAETLARAPPGPRSLNPSTPRRSEPSHAAG